MITQLAVAKPLDKLHGALSAHFPAKKVDEILNHYAILKREARLDHYETCLVNGGKFVEAVLKCLHYRRTVEVVESVKVDDEIRQLEGAISLDDSERMTIPRILRAIYECRNKRGGAHNVSFDPTKMDCVFVVNASNWVIEELTRLYLTNDPVAALSLVENLLVKDIPMVEQIDGDSLVLIPGLPARVQLEILLFQHHPERCTLRDLIRWVHNHNEHNIRVTLSKMKSQNLAHETDSGWKLTDSGIREAEAEIAKLQNGSSGSRKKRTVKAQGVNRGRR
jgi:hypothetical protein